MSDLSYINSELFQKLNGVKNETTDFLEILKERRTLKLNLDDTNNRTSYGRDFNKWKTNEYNKQIQKRDDEITSRKGDLILQLEELLEHLRSF